MNMKQRHCMHYNYTGLQPQLTWWVREPIVIVLEQMFYRTLIVVEKGLLMVIYIFEFLWAPYGLIN